MKILTENIVNLFWKLNVTQDFYTQNKVYKEIYINYTEIASIEIVYVNSNDGSKSDKKVDETYYILYRLKLKSTDIYYVTPVSFNKNYIDLFGKSIFSDD